MLRADVTVADRLTACVHADAGEVIAVVGANGAGKTTLLHALAGVVECTGSVNVDGEPWTAAAGPGHSRPLPERRVGLVFQDRLLFGHLSARENVAFGPRARGTDRRTARALADEWLTRFEIGDLARRRPAQLSGGQAQRVAIARALAVEPRLLLLDEPMAGLDVGAADRLRGLLHAHLEEFTGVTLLSTHHLADIRAMAHRLLVVEDGRVVDDGPVDDVLARRRTAHLAGLVATGS